MIVYTSAKSVENLMVVAPDTGGADAPELTRNDSMPVWLCATSGAESECPEVMNVVGDVEGKIV